MELNELISKLRDISMGVDMSIRYLIREACNRLGSQQTRIAQLEAELKEERRWIPVGEDLPKKITNKVNVLCKNGYRGFGHFEKHNGEQIWYNLESGEPFTNWDLEDCESYEVTHWAHLPKPPEVDR